MPVLVEVKGERFSEITFSTKELMREIGLLARERILTRVAAGLDTDGDAFAPYSSAYALWKEHQIGGVFGQGGSGTVNLQVSGAMLAALVITELTDKSVTLGFSS